MRPLLIGFILCLHISQGYAQWSEQDSVWLQNVLAGKDSVRLNPEFQKAIKNGTFLNSGQPAGKMQIAPSSIPITKDFSEYIQSEEKSHRKVALKDLPPNVFWWHTPPPMPILPVLKSIIDEIGQKPVTAPSGTFFDMATLTSRKAYVHNRNAKRDATRRNYNDLPTPDIIRKRKAFLKKQEEVATDTIKRDTTWAKKDTVSYSMP